MQSAQGESVAKSENAPVGGSGMRFGGGGSGLKLSGVSVAEWSVQVDEGIAYAAAEGDRNGLDAQSDEWVAANGVGRVSSVRTETVRAGQTLSGLAGTNDPGRLDRIAEYNGLRSRHEIVAGQTVAIPDAETLSGIDVSAARVQRGAAGAVYYAQRQVDLTADFQSASLVDVDGMRIGPTIEQAKAQGIYSGGVGASATRGETIGSPGAYISAWDGVSRDPYARTGNSLAAALAGPQVAAVVLIPATSASMAAAGAVYSTVGPLGTAGIGFGTSAGMDAGMQYYEKRTVDRYAQTLFAGATGAIGGPLGATSGLWTNVVVGAASGGLNTQFQNYWYEDNKSLGLPAAMGGAFGALGYRVGAQTTSGISYFAPELSYATLNPRIPALFQPMAINQVPQILGVAMGGVVSGTAPLGETAFQRLLLTPRKP